MNSLRMAVFAAALLPASPVLAQERLELPDAINRALERNPELLRARLAIDSGRLREEDAATEFRPNVLPELSYSRFAGENAMRAGARATQKLEWGSVVSASVGEVHTASGTRPSKRFEVQQPLFRNFGTEVNREPLRQAASASAAARRRYELQKADLVLRVAQSYENILRLKRQLAADAEAYKRNDALYRVTLAKEGLGKSTRVDTLRVELLRGQAEARLEAGSQRLAEAQRDFAEYLGAPADAVFALEPAPALELAVPRDQEAVDVALENRLDYAQALQDYADARRAARLAGRRTMPDLRLTVSYDDFPTTLTSFGSVPFGTPLWFIGLSVPTEYNLARERIAVEQARIVRISAEQALAMLKRSITRQVLQSLEANRRAAAEVRIAQQNRALAERRARLARTLYDLGRGDNFAVTDAEVSFLEAESGLFSARTDASIAAYQLARVLGKIVEVPQELKLDRYKIDE